MSVPLTPELDERVRLLASRPDNVCPCGWFWKSECKKECRAPVIKMLAEK